MLPYGADLNVVTTREGKGDRKGKGTEGRGDRHLYRYLIVIKVPVPFLALSPFLPQVLRNLPCPLFQVSGCPANADACRGEVRWPSHRERTKSAAPNGAGWWELRLRPSVESVPAQMRTATARTATRTIRSPQAESSAGGTGAPGLTRPSWTSPRPAAHGPRGRHRSPPSGRRCVKRRGSGGRLPPVSKPGSTEGCGWNSCQCIGPAPSKEVTSNPRRPACRLDNGHSGASRRLVYRLPWAGREQQGLEYQDGTT
jgi:hypothetical protein